jgi:FkbM family methyltransferase
LKDGRSFGRPLEPRSFAKRVARRALTPFLGRSRLQPIFEALHALALAGQNYGEGNAPAASGERVVIELVDRRRQAGEPLRIFDVGANVGAYTSQVLSIAREPLEIWCFEPSPTTFDVLRREFASQPDVRTFNVGLSDRAGSATLVSAGPGSKLASLHDTTARLARSGFGAPLREEVELMTLDAFCRSNSVDRIDLLKLDVEGHELSVLLGAAAYLASGKIRAIQFEFGAANIDARTYFRDFYDLLGRDYSLSRVLQDGIWPMASYRESYEVFKRATNYLALRSTP